MTSSVANCLQPKNGASANPYRDLKQLGVAAKANVIHPGTPAEERIPHAALLYRRKKIEIRIFHLEDHKKITDATAPTDFVWIEPNIPEERAKLVASKARLVHQQHKANGIPYGFGFRTSSFDKAGSFRLGEGEVGLTCATIVAAIFESEKIKLLEPTGWPGPDSDDKRKRRTFIDHLKKHDAAHAALLEKDIDAPRISPEEVVAASAIHPTVGTFANLQTGAADVRARIGT